LIAQSTHPRPPVLDAIAQWRDRPLSEFPSASPPCDALGDSSADRVLAAVFQTIATDRDGLHRLLYLNDLIQLHTKRVVVAITAQPKRLDELRPWLLMIATLTRWFVALYGVRVTS